MPEHDKDRLTSVAQQEVDSSAPAPERVARRMLCLMAVSGRGFLEPYYREPGVDDAVREIIEWVAALNIDDELEPSERELLDRPLGIPDPLQFIDASWRIEGAGVLAWALGLFNLPPYDTPVHPGDLREVVGYLHCDAVKLVETASLRRREELDQFTDRMFALHWRLRAYARDGAAIDFARTAKEVWFGPLDIELARLADGDLAIGELSIRQCSDNERRTCLSIVGERHQAANWLAGYADIYSEVDTST